MGLALNVKTPILKEELNEAWINGWEEAKENLIAAFGLEDRRKLRTVNREPTSDEEYYMALADKTAAMTFDNESGESSGE